MTTQITVRLPDDLVAFIDQQVTTGTASSRADLVAMAVQREQRRQVMERDAAIYAASAADPDLAALAQFAAAQPLDLD